MAGLRLVAGNYSVAPADGTGAHLALDCGGHARAFTLDLSNSTLVMQVLLAAASFPTLPYQPGFRAGVAGLFLSGALIRTPE